MTFGFSPRATGAGLLVLVAAFAPAPCLGQSNAADGGVALDAAADAGLSRLPGPWTRSRSEELYGVDASVADAESQKAASVQALAQGEGPRNSPQPTHGEPLTLEAEALPVVPSLRNETPSRSARPLNWPVEDNAEPASNLSDLVLDVVDEEHGSAAFWGWLALALLAWLVDGLLRRRSANFTDTGLLPSLQSVASLTWHAALLLGLLFLVLRAVPMSWLPDLRWVVLGGLLIAAWSVRGVLSDLVARVVMAIDGKVRPRLMVQTPELTGRVSRVGVRQTDIVDAIGRTWALPNRKLLSAQVREPSETHVHASLMLDVPNKRVIEDAALASAWIHPDGLVHVWRDASDTRLWHVETTLISHDFERVFRSDLAERVREHLHGKTQVPRTPVAEESTSESPAKDAPAESLDDPDSN